MKAIKLPPILIFCLFISFTHAQVYDFEGNRYDTVRVGTQIWLKQNIKSLYYSDGTPIDSGVYAYNNDTSIAKIHGYMYTYGAVRRNDSAGTNIQGVCPNNYHLPTQDDWRALFKNIGGREGGPPYKRFTGAEYLKDDKTWNGLNTYGLTIMPGGIYTGSFYLIGSEVELWAGSGFKASFGNRFTNDEFIQPFSFSPIVTPDWALYCRCIKNGITSAIEEIKERTENINIYPNPATDYLIISGIAAANIEIKLCNSLGQEIFVNKTTGTEYLKVDISKLSNGVYILMIRSGKEIIARKVVKE